MTLRSFNGESGRASHVMHKFTNCELQQFSYKDP